MTTPPSAFHEAVARYRHDPVLFVREVFSFEPDEWQIEAFQALADENDTMLAIRAGNGVGKTCFEALGIVWALCCVYPQHTLVTAPSAPQLFGALAKEVKIWMGRLPEAWQQIFEIKAESIHHKAAPFESLVEFRTSRPETPEALSGVHMEGTAEFPGRVYLWADEASGIMEPVLSAALGAMSGHRTMLIMVGNPLRLAGTFFEAFHKQREMWHTIHVPSHSCPRVTEKFRLLCISRGKNHYKVFYEGEFPDAEGDSVIPRDWVMAALHREVAPQWVRPVWGVDVAYKGGDRCALAKRKGNILLEPVDAWEGIDTMESVAHILAEYETTPDKLKPSDICVDAIGMGTPIAHRLRELGLPAREINVAESSALKERYPNLRSELTYEARSWFEAKNCSLAGDTELASELCSYERQDRTDRKEGVKPKRGTMAAESDYNSPDLADSFILTFAVRAITAAGSYNSSTMPSAKRKIQGLI